MYGIMMLRTSSYKRFSMHQIVETTVFVDSVDSHEIEAPAGGEVLVLLSSTIIPTATRPLPTSLVLVLTTAELGFLSRFRKSGMSHGR
jgi:hypothetical protein